MIEYKCLHVQKGSLLLPAADLEAFDSGPREAMDQGAVDPLKVSLHTCRLSVSLVYMCGLAVLQLEQESLSQRFHMFLFFSISVLRYLFVMPPFR